MRPVVVLDPAMPVDRLATILELSGATTVLADRANEVVGRDIGRAHSTVLLVEEMLAERSDSVAVEVSAPDPAWAAAILFTSGSSGRPKGVVWSRGLIAFDAMATAERLHLRTGDRVAMPLPISFAAGLLVVVAALVSGASLHLRDPRRVGSRDFLRWTASERATLLPTTPSLLRGLVRAMEEGEVLADLRVVSACGEPLFSRDVNSVRPHLSRDCLIVGWFGSSEGGSLAFIDYAGNDELPDGAIPAGTANLGRTLAVWDGDDKPVASGTAGSVVVISRITASGYWRDPARTNERFTALADGTTLLRTGDIGQLDDSGCLRLLGRSEAAIKIGGYFVDPSEIEAALLALDSVAEAVVVAVTEDLAARLVAYVVPAQGSRTPSVAQLRASIAAKLPGWMVPTHIVLLPTLPRNERGKVDRAQLPHVSARQVEPLLTVMEEEIASVWRGVLAMDEVGRFDDFLSLGGDSLAVEEMLIRVEALTGVAVSTSDFTEAPVLGEFAQRVEAARDSGRRTSTVTVTLRHGDGHNDGGPAVICIAGAGESAIAFLPLAALLPESFSVVAVQARGFEGRAVAEWSLERMARRRARSIRQLQPAGPHILVGHSMGAILAVRIAQLLESDGAEVSLVVLIDPFVNETAVGRSRRARRRRQERSRGERPSDEVGWRALLLKAKVTLVLPFAGVLQFRPGRQQVLFFHQGTLISHWHRPTPWAGRTLAYRTRDNMDPIGVWEWLLPGEHQVRDFACDHHSVVRDPYIGVIAADILDELAMIAGNSASAPTRSPSSGAAS